MSFSKPISDFVTSAPWVGRRKETIPKVERMKRLWKRCYRQQDIWSSYQFAGMMMRGKNLEFWTLTSSLLLKRVWQDKHVHVSMLSTKQLHLRIRLNCCWLDLRLLVVSFFDPPTARHQTSSSP
ncbi:hypothetical protein BLNAU_13434 [Blattamonas nauphoetae]|uniref:Uncharacterized protein n=1 Tax=Blattamonas nauphoetae TaxID=2049346 RepID=A0ABQ9WPE3_9EUKA|nr:hypothetical protein BLNAU_25170 [Blattamonas nauphoetae]KAK2939979.1 hypothetical protein BLNAU_25107 [Blattamonas nauphoetae]KAK2951550.1 hypothetical protein BLNAU_13434 [Blattamonas nauphoetae]